MSDAGLVRALEAGFAVRRQVDAALARLAGQVSARSVRTLGPDGLASRLGTASAAHLLAERGLVSMIEASRLCRVGAATGERVSFLGERLRADFPVVAEALAAGTIPVDSALWIIRNLAEATPRADRDDLAEAERVLAQFAAEHPADVVRKLAVRYRDALDTEGIAPREEKLADLVTLRRSLRANGMTRYTLDADPLGSAYLDAVLDAQIASALHTDRGTDDETPERRSIGQLGAAAIIDLARHGLGCADSPAPLASATIVVRMTEEQLRTGLGEAQLDGQEQPISAGTARRLAADGEIIPAVLGGNSATLDYGTTRRLFSRLQRIAFAERDGGCAWPHCTRPPAHAEAHHLTWWGAGGLSNLANGALTCGFHHHRIHRDGWQITVTDNVVWITPPHSVDIYRTPRRGGRLPVPAMTVRPPPWDTG